MTTQEFINCGITRQSKSVSCGERNILPSVADPTQAQSGRDLVFNPKPIVNNRVTYSAGVAAKDMQPFDKMYADKLNVFGAAKRVNDDTHSKIQDFEKKQNQAKQEPVTTEK